MMKDTKISRKPSNLRAKAAALALVALASATLPVTPALAGGYGHGYGHGRHGYGGGYGHHGGYSRHGGHHGHHDGAAIVVAAGVGLLVGAALASRPAYYTPPPARVAYAPPPGYYNQAPLVAEPASDVYRSRSGQYCREYQSTIRVGGRLERSYGTACLEEDGAWRVVD